MFWPRVGRVGDCVQPEEFLGQARLLTGSEIKGEAEIDRASLGAILADDNRHIDCSQFNELLLLVHKDRVEGPFFHHFFGTDCTVGGIPKGVEKFQKAAMLLYGNFVFAYRTLSRIKAPDVFQRKLGDAARDPKEELQRFRSRKPKLLEIDGLDRELTPYVGYLSAGQISAERDRCELLCRAIEQVGKLADWDNYLEEVESLARVEEHPVLLEVIENYRARFPASTFAEWGQFLETSLGTLSELRSQVRDVRRRATQNQNTYLTWDHMDVYFATSMRKAWEYEDLYDFIENLMSADELKELAPVDHPEGQHIRYFDPTQSYTDNRVNKGLVEALMLKRARCTVYSVQDTDTLGKDSELASTLAQGKPVIAFIPNVPVEKRVAKLMTEHPVTILERLRFVLYADEKLAQRLSDEEYGLVGGIEDQLDSFASSRIWLSIPDHAAIGDLKSRLGNDLEAFCRIIARSEQAVYDKRERRPSGNLIRLLFR